MGIPASKRNFERIARYADGWLPWGFDFHAENFGAHVEQLLREFEAAGRSFLTVIFIPVTLFAAPAGIRPTGRDLFLDPQPLETKRRSAAGVSM